MALYITIGEVFFLYQIIRKEITITKCTYYNYKLEVFIIKKKKKFEIIFFLRKIFIPDQACLADKVRGL